MRTCSRVTALGGTVFGDVFTLALILALSTLAAAQPAHVTLRPITPVPLTPQLIAVRFVDGSRAIAAGDMGAVFVGTDSGRSWARVETGTTTPVRGLAVA